MPHIHGVKSRLFGNGRVDKMAVIARPLCTVSSKYFLLLFVIVLVLLKPSLGHVDHKKVLHGFISKLEVTNIGKLPTYIYQHQDLRCIERWKNENTFH